jgi:hypothetical protein
MNTCSVSTAKCTIARRSSALRGSRSRRYCSLASSAVCPVRWFLISAVATGMPFRNSPTSIVFEDDGSYGSCRVTVSRFAWYLASRSALSPDAGRKNASWMSAFSCPAYTIPCRSTSTVPRLSSSFDRRTANARCASSGDECDRRTFSHSSGCVAPMNENSSAVSSAKSGEKSSARSAALPTFTAE